jgi:membrane-associated phospholipid phosphatase
MTAMRWLNVWILDHADIHTSVFPSGHVAVAWSAAFGLMTALPERKPAGAIMAGLATLVAAATIYGRYHYAVDAVASIAVSVAAWRIESLLLQARPRRLPSVTASDSQSCS